MPRSLTPPPPDDDDDELLAAASSPVRFASEARGGTDAAGSTSVPVASLPASLLQGELARIVASDAFRGSLRHQRFLTWLVDQALRGPGPRPKEITLGIEVFGRQASRFDPQKDTIVRVEARRLRARLARYYAAEGRDSLIEIALPVGSYVPMVSRRHAASQAASLVVLPIVDRSGAALGPAFCDDVVDTLIDAVARIPGFKVIARTSAARAADAADTAADAVDARSDRAVALRLDVAWVMHGTLDRDDVVLRLKLRLAHGVTGERSWSGTWTLPIDSDFATRDATMARIVDDVQRGLPSFGRRSLRRAAPASAGEPVDERARDLVDRGRYLMRHGPVDAYPQALHRFRDAAAIAPDFAAAHFGIARSLSYLLGMTQIAPQDGVDEARAAARRALALDPQHGDAASILAGLQQRFDHDWQAAQAGYLAAIASTPGSLYVHFNYAFGLMFAGRFDEAEAELRLAHELDPLDLGQRATQALLHLYRRDYARAEAVLDALLDDEPRHLLARTLRGSLHLLAGRSDEALDAYRIAERSMPDLSIGLVGIAQAHALAGRRDEARAARAALVASFAGRYLSPYQLALIDLRLGDVDGAFERLAQSAVERDPNFIAVLVDPSLDGLRADPRFAALLAAHRLDDVLPTDAAGAGPDVRS